MGSASIEIPLIDIERDSNGRYLPCNEVLLIGRVSSIAQSRELPSGDVVVEVRLVVERGKKGSRSGKKREVDTLDLAIWKARLQKRALKVEVDEWIYVEGAVRRRFWQAPHGLASRWQVEVDELTVLPAQTIKEQTPRALKRP